jgi:hypothetical protein
MTTIRVRLMQESGVSGPTATIEAGDTPAEQFWAAREWAAGQTGHPWDVLTVEDGGECREVPQD